MRIRIFHVAADMSRGAVTVVRERWVSNTQNPG
jgi:hypothetical protein